jgi:hypothetical protein
MGITVLDAPPREPEWRSWLYVALWSLVIFFTIPFARALRDAVEERIGLGFFVYATVVIALVGGAVALANVRRRSLPRSAYLWLIGVTAAFIAYAYELRDIPEEAIHVAEYGFLGFLVYRALVHRIRDYSIYLVAILIVGTIGMVEEYIQWVVPSRFFDLRDVRTNFVAGALSQVAIAKGLRPSLVQGPPSGASLRRLCQSTALALVVLSVSYLNTPQRVSWYASRIPFLAFLLDSHSDMVDYGYRHHDSEIGAFQSRFSLEELRRFDRQRGAELAEILDRYIGGEGYDAFLKAYSVPRDAYTHEAGVHLFRRNRYLERAMAKEEHRQAHSTVALRENQLLEKYFPTAIQRSSHAWTSDTREFVEGHAEDGEAYVSPVSSTLVTQFSERGVLLAFAVAIAALMLLGASLSRGAPTLIDGSEGQRP